MQSASRNSSYPTDDSPSDDTLVGLSDEALLSAWMDGEECGDYGQSHDEGNQNRQTWDTYHLIGDVLRNPDLGIKPSPAFRARLTRALDAELPIIAAPKRRNSLRLSLSGLAAAAAVATVVWVVQPYVADDSSAGGTRVAEANFGQTSAADDAALSDYLEAHRQMAGPSAVRQVSFSGGVER